jgi:hypothetical protein
VLRFSVAWRGWRIGDEEIVSPDGWRTSRNDALAVPLLHGQIACAGPPCSPACRNAASAGHLSLWAYPQSPGVGQWPDHQRRILGLSKSSSRDCRQAQSAMWRLLPTPCARSSRATVGRKWRLHSRSYWRSSWRVRISIETGLLRETYRILRHWCRYELCAGADAAYSRPQSELSFSSDATNSVSVTGTRRGRRRPCHISSRAMFR